MEGEGSNYIELHFRRPDWAKALKRPSENKAELFFVFVFLRLQIFVDFRQGANQQIRFGRFILREQGHVAVAECYADAEATGRFSSNNVIFRIAHHQHIGNVDAQNFGRMLKRQWAGFFLSQAVAAENQAEIVVEIKLFQ